MIFIIVLLLLILVLAIPEARALLFGLISLAIGLAILGVILIGAFFVLALIFGG